LPAVVHHQRAAIAGPPPLPAFSRSLAWVAPTALAALGIMALFSVFKTVDFSSIFACAPQFAGTSFIFCNVK